MDIPGSMLVRTWEYGVEVAWAFYNSANDWMPSRWENYSNVLFLTEERPLMGLVDVYREFINSEGEGGKSYYRIGDDGVWFLCYEERYLADNINCIQKTWIEEDQLYLQTVLVNGREVYADRVTLDGETVAHLTWEYFNGIGPVITERGNGRAYEKIYTDPDDLSTYEERVFVNESDYVRTFTVKGLSRIADDSVLKLPSRTRVIESGAFADVSAWIVVLPSGVTSIAGYAFDADTVLLVPNEEVAAAARNAGYAWFFE